MVKEHQITGNVFGRIQIKGFPCRIKLTQTIRKSRIRNFSRLCFRIKRMGIFLGFFFHLLLQRIDLLVQGGKLSIERIILFEIIRLRRSIPDRTGNFGIFFLPLGCFRIDRFLRRGFL